jgi:hypothetical protein
MDVNVSTTKLAYIDVYQYSVKKSSQCTCLGWVNNPIIPDTDPLVLLAVADLSEDVQGTDAAIRYEIVKDGTDYRLQFSNSLSKKITKTIGINLTDGKWHFLGYVCTGNGVMMYYVDGVSLPVEDGVSDGGVLYATAWSRSGRQGGGAVWCPYLYKAGQSVAVYNWRFASNLQIHQGWIQELMAKEKPALETV